MEATFELKPLTLLAKVFPDKIYGDEQTCFTGFVGEEVNFQIAMRSIAQKYNQKAYTFEIISDFSDISVYEVGHVPSWLAAYPTVADEDYLTKEAGLFPDPLLPICGNTVSAAVGKWSTMWVSIKIPYEVCAGEHCIIAQRIEKI